MRQSRLPIPESRHPRPGLTLVEMLVSVVLTLLIVFAVVQAFDLMGDTITLSRASIEMAGPLRKSYVQLQEDLDTVTCRVRPWIDPDAAGGFFEYQEGPASDADRNANGVMDTDVVTDLDGNNIPDEDANRDGVPDLTYFGDLDDVLWCTIQSTGTPFRGRGPTGIVESTLAEVVWWVAQIDLNNNGTADDTDPAVLLRRLLLIRPDLNTATNTPRHIPGPVPQFFMKFDISARIEFIPATAGGPPVTPVMVANSMSDVASRRNRFAHRAPNGYEPPPNSPSFPNPTVLAAISPTDLTLELLATNSANLSEQAWSFLPRLVSLVDMQGPAADWVVLSDVVAFDVRAYDPSATLLGTSSTNMVMMPGDYGYPRTLPNPVPVPVSRGGYVDLGYWNAVAGNTALRSQFSTTSPIPPPSPLLVGGTYETWSLGYERDGIDQDRDNAIDEGTDELDSNNDGVVDDPAERETQPPYPAPLRGIEVRIRTIDIGTKQVRQVSVVGDFAGKQ